MTFKNCSSSSPFITDNVYFVDQLFLNSKIFLLSSDPGHTLLPPIDAFEDLEEHDGPRPELSQPIDGFVDMEKDKLSGSDTNIVDPNVNNGRVEIKLHKMFTKKRSSESGAVTAGREQESDVSNARKRRVLQISRRNGVDSSDEDIGVAQPESSVGFKAPLGMRFQPMCSACDESTDGE